MASGFIKDGASIEINSADFNGLLTWAANKDLELNKAAMPVPPRGSSGAPTIFLMKERRLGTGIFFIMDMSLVSE
jgi:hypothetical protein